MLYKNFMSGNFYPDLRNLVFYLVYDIIEFQENIKGSITVGKLADLVILSDNIFTIPTRQIEKVKVWQTIMDGRIVYEAK